MKTVLRWGRSAYETTADVELEQRSAEDLGLRWRMAPDPHVEPSFANTDALVVSSAVRVDADVLSRGELVAHEVLKDHADSLSKHVDVPGV